MFRRGATEVAVERRGQVHIHASTRSALIALIAAATIVSTPVLARAENVGAELGIGTACALSNLIYGPLKVLYAMGGALVSGLAWGLSAGDTDVARPIWDTAMRGDYVIEPDHLRGRKPLEFLGRLPTHRRAMDPPPPEESIVEGF
jgi:hypothetical protein